MTGTVTVVSGAFAALGAVGKTLERITELNADSERMRQQTKQVRVQAKVIHHKIGAACSITMEMLAERRRALRLMSDTLREHLKTARIGVAAVSRALDTISERVATVPFESPHFVALLESQYLLSTMVSAENAKVLGAATDLVDRIQAKLVAISIPAVHLARLGEGGDAK